MKYISTSAVVSECGAYRYRLGRVWDKSLPEVAWCMLNPSTADADDDDPTIRRCVGLSQSWGYGGIVVVNLFAMRATDPKELKRATSPVGPDNNQHIRDVVDSVRRVIVAWGSVVTSLDKPSIRNRDAAVLTLLRRSEALFVGHVGLTKDGHPRHPLYVKGDIRPEVFVRTDG